MKTREHKPFLYHPMNKDLNKYNPFIDYINRNVR